MLMKKQRKGSYIERSYEELSDIVGEEFVLGDLNFMLLKTMEYVKTPLFDIKIIENFYDKTFSIYDNKSKQLLALIDKLEYSSKHYFCKPYLILNRLSAKILDQYKNEFLEGEYETTDNDNLISDLFFRNELPENEKLSDYLFQVCLILIYQFNIDIIKSKVSCIEPEIVILDCSKDELIFDKKNNELQMQQVIYLITIRNNSNFVNIVKIFEDNKKETHLLNLNEYFMQDYDIINE